MALHSAELVSFAFEISFKMGKKNIVTPNTSKVTFSGRLVRIYQRSMHSKFHSLKAYDLLRPGIMKGLGRILCLCSK